MPRLRSNARQLGKGAVVVVLAVVAYLVTACVSDPCRKDLGRWCGLEKDGTPAFERCVARHLDKFSAACRQDLTTKKGKK
jgi:hypothetical protein